MSPALLIDDNLTQLRIREAVLREAGLSVSCASTAEQALTFLRSVAARPDVIVTGHVSPGASSAFVRKLQDRPARLRDRDQRNGGSRGGVRRPPGPLPAKAVCPPKCLVREAQTALAPVAPT